jgi:hypothetical protein
LFAGAVHDTAAEVEDPIAFTAGGAGAPTVIGGVTAAGPEPIKFFATIRNE